MLQAIDLSKRYGDLLLFEKVHFAIDNGDRVGLVGGNGCGKTTLMRILVGKEEPSSGHVRCTWPAHQVGYLPQALAYEDDATVGTVLRGPEMRGEAYWAQRLQRVAEQLATADAASLPAVQLSYDRILERLVKVQRTLPQHRVYEVLAALELDELDADQPVRILSGGQKTRLGLARLLLRNPSLLLLDEPTNHLDIRGLEWLESYLTNYDGALLLVSHDRTFLNRTITQVLEMNKTTKRVTAYAGDYDDYAAAKARERRKTWQQYHEQRERIGRLQSAISDAKGQASGIEKSTIDFHYRKRAKKVARQAVVHERRLQRLLDSEDLVEKPKQGWDMYLDFVETPESGKEVVTLEGLGKRFGEQVLFDSVDLILTRGERVVFVGPNGSGKTTLLRIIAGLERPSAGSVRLGARVKVGYLSQEQEGLNWDLTPLSYVQQVAGLNETKARNFLHFFLFAGDDVFTRIGDLSWGERTRLALGRLVLQGCNLLLLDEPVNHLDIASRESFEDALASYHGTVLMVAHDRYLVERFASSVWALEDGTIRRYVDLNKALQAMRIPKGDRQQEQ